MPRDDPKFIKNLSDAGEQLSVAIRESRTLSYLLHPPLLDLVGLESALAWYVEGFATRSGVSVDLEFLHFFR